MKLVIHLEILIDFTFTGEYFQLSMHRFKDSQLLL
jgi:hypothetical protein